MDRIENMAIDTASTIQIDTLDTLYSEKIKRLVDILLSLALLPILLPFLLIISLLIKINSKGPIIYKSNRVGRFGENFYCLKFRTMFTDAENTLKRILDEDPQLRSEWERDQKLKNDPRVTKIGKILRKLSLDELPQMFNVLKGEMSLVGPRPIVAAEIGKYGKSFQYYQSVRPGITGLWQTSGRNDVSYDERVAFDKLYSLENNLLMDIKILFKTVPVALSKRGAY